jgi:hypothetical protein
METVLGQFEILLLYLLGEIEDIHESLSHFSRSPGRGLNPGLLEYKVGVLTTRLQHSVEVNCELQFPISLFPRETIRDAR